MNETTSIKPPTWFWIVVALSLVWNLMGVMAYIAQVTMTEEALNALPEAERLLYEATPAWANGAFAFAVWGGALGCLLLLLRKRFATPVLIISLLGVIVQMYHSFFIIDSMAVYGPGDVIMPIMVVAVAIYLVYLSRSASAKDWLT